MPKTLFIRNLSKEELQAIDILKKETGSSSMSKAVRNGLAAVIRLRTDYKECIAENVRLRRQIAEMGRTMEKINALSKPFDK